MAIKPQQAPEIGEGDRHLIPALQPPADPHYLSQAHLETVRQKLKGLRALEKSLVQFVENCANGLLMVKRLAQSWMAPSWVTSSRLNWVYFGETSARDARTVSFGLTLV